MAFGNRSSRYDRSEEPTTPYQKAANAWDNRIGNARSAARNWRLIALGELVLALVLVAGLIAVAMKGHVETYVVRVDKSGEPTSVKLAGNVYHPGKAEIAYFLGKWVRNVRSKPADAVVLKKQWLEAYDFLGRQATATLNAYAKKHDPFKNVGQDTRTVHIQNIVQKSNKTYQVQWTEKNYRNDAPVSTHSFTGLFTIEMHPPDDQQAVYKNPLGIYITSLNWSANS